jgi:opacity protein-like surface antigen
MCHALAFGGDFDSGTLLAFASGMSTSMRLSPTLLGRFIVASVVVTMCATSAPAAAQTTPGTARPAGASLQALPPEIDGITITPFVGLGFSGDLGNSPAGFGAAADYGLSSRASAEGELYFMHGARSRLDTTVWSLSGDLIYHATGNGQSVTPYVAAGLGLMRGEIDDSAGSGSSSALSLNFGAGIKTAMSSKWGLRGDVRFFSGHDLAPEYWRLYGGVVFRQLGF